jgi:hypothetical protein
MQQNTAMPEEMATIQPPPRGMKIQDAANYCGVNSWFIRRSIWDGCLKARQGGKFIIVLKEDLDQFLSSLPVIEPNNAEWLKQRREGRAR